MNRKKGAREKNLSGHFITLHQRLYHALELGFSRHSNSKERKWWSNDVETQRLAVRSISSFLDGISSDSIQLPIVKDSIPDIVGALEGILQLKNEALLGMTSAVAVKLVSTLPSSFLQPHVHFVHPLASLLSFHQSQVANNCATALKLIISNLSAKHEKRVWEILKGTDAVSQIISKLLYFHGGYKTAENALEMAALLGTILQRWPLSRYPVWSDDNLMKTLTAICLKPDSSSKVVMFQLFSALALCGYGAQKLLDDDDLLELIVDNMGKSYSSSIRIQAFKVFKALTVSDQGCSKMLRSYYESITNSVLSGMNGWTENSVKVSGDEMYLLVESCQSLALIIRQPGKHHNLLWKYGIEKVLFDLTVNSQKTRILDESLSLEEMINVILEEGFHTNFHIVLRPYVLGSLGWLVTLSDVKYVPSAPQSKQYLKILITMTCLAFVESIGRKRQTFQADPANIYWIRAAAKTTLMMVYSPCKFVASHAKSVLAKILDLDGMDCLKFLLRTASFSSSTNNLLVTNKFQLVINMIGLVCYSGMPLFYKNVIEDKGVEILLEFIKRWLNNCFQVQTVGMTSNLQGIYDEKSCCRLDNEEWEGTEAPLLLSLWSLSELLKNSYSDGLQMDIFAGQTAYNKDQLISDLQYISVSSNSAGLRWHASYLLSFLGLYGFTSKLAKRIGAALGEKEIADVKMNLKSGECLSVHGVVLLVRCPLLLPPQRTTDEEKICHHTELVIDGSLRFHKEITLSAQVDLQALEKLLDFIYTGYVQVEEETLMRKLKLFARHCNLQPLLHLLSRRRPKWGDPFPVFDLTSAFGSSGLEFSDIILEAKSAKSEDWKCSLCDLSGPHMHAHKIVLLSSCDYMRALFLSGMQESHSQTLQVPVSLEALHKLAIWFYSGELPKPVTSGCLWINTDLDAKLAEIQPYIELCWLAEYWMLDEVHSECSEIVTSCLDNACELAVEILRISAQFCQWRLVEFAANVAGPCYPSLRECGALDCLDEELIDMIRAASVRVSQSCREG